MLSGTGFEGHGATGWLRTSISTQPEDTDDQEIILLFAIWDSGDGILDSSVVLDNFKWHQIPVNGSSTQPVAP